MVEKRFLMKAGQPYKPLRSPLLLRLQVQVVVVAGAVVLHQ